MEDYRGINVWPSPRQRGITDYATNEECIIAALKNLYRDQHFIATDSRYSAGDDRRGYEARCARIKSLLLAFGESV